MPVKVERTGAVAVVTFSEPPVNSLGYATRAALVNAIDAAVDDDGIDAIVLSGGGGMFSGGADIREFDTAGFLRGPTLRDLIATVEASTKPVVAAIEGICLGGGFELALACHYRVAGVKASMALPEIKLGLLPGSGGTQRLPRLVGVEKALNMIASGERYPAPHFERTPLLDAVVIDNVEAAAIELARTRGEAHSRGEALPRARDRQVDEPGAEGLLGFAREQMQLSNAVPAALSKIVDCIAAATRVDFERGLTLEASSFAELLHSPVSRGLRHQFFAERLASRIPDVPPTTPAQQLRSAAVVGAGTMGAGITVTLLNAGLPVRLLDMSQAALDRGIARVNEIYASQLKRKRLSSQQVAERTARLAPTLSFADLADCDIVIEAVFEDMATKQSVFRALDATLKVDAVLATNTSMLDVDKIAAATNRPGQVVGTHFFVPANVMPLLEIVRGAATSAQVLATTVKLAKTLGKTPVVARVCEGFIGNRMVEEYLRQAYFMLEEGASPQQIDAAIEKFGFAMGPFKVSDIAGNDLGFHIREQRRRNAPHIVYSALPDKLVEMKRFGQKSSAGWYDYRPGSRGASVSAIVADLIDRHRSTLGTSIRRLPDSEIVDRLLYALVNEGARILEEGIAIRASDIDVVYAKGYGFPAWRGGPMWHADQVGLFRVLRRMREFAQAEGGDAAFWKPAPLIQQLADEGRTFNGQDTRP